MEHPILATAPLEIGGNLRFSAHFNARRFGDARDIARRSKFSGVGIEMKDDDGIGVLIRSQQERAVRADGEIPGGLP